MRGIIGIDVQLQDITKLIRNIKLGENGTVALMQTEGTMIANPLETSLNFKNVKSDSVKSVFGKILTKEPGKYASIKVDGKGYYGLVSETPMVNASWNLVGFINSHDINGTLLLRAVATFVLVTLITIFMILAVRFYVNKKLLVPFGGVIRFIQGVSKGDFETVIVKDRDDELGEIQSALQEMTTSLREKTVLAQKIAGGDLTDCGKPSSADDSLGLALENMVISLNGIMHEMSGMSDQVSLGADQLAQASTMLSDGATHQAAAVEEISSSVNEIQAQVKQNAERATLARTLSEESRKTAEVGSAQMKEMLNAMDQISRSSREISRIMKVIDDIAFQTNLLALNAAVEAARAGQHGKGFAVVADEVRSLAQRSAKASAETADFINAALETIDHGNKIAEETSESFNKIVVNISGSADSIREIASSAAEESLSLSEIAQGLEQISMVTQQNSAGSEETAATSTELSQHAAQLQSAVRRFRLKDSSESSMKAVTEKSPKKISTPAIHPQETGQSRNAYLSYGEY